VAQVVHPVSDHVHLAPRKFAQVSGDLLGRGDDHLRAAAEDSLGIGNTWIAAHGGVQVRRTVRKRRA